MWPADHAWRAPVGDFPPRWASAWGDDCFGLWADLTVAGVMQRMRWIEPTGPEGFWMGSDQSEQDVAEIQITEGLDRKRWRAYLSKEGPKHQVILSKGLWLADTPCTQGLWKAVMGSNPSAFRDRQDANDRPVEQVSWLDVVAFLTKLPLRHFSIESWQVGLPLEAEWEYACRASSNTEYSWGDGFMRDRAAVLTAETIAVKRFAPNDWGLYDMHGNVWEWCGDGPRAYREERATDPSGPKAMQGTGSLRGGAFDTEPWMARSASREDMRPSSAWPRTGFRFCIRLPNGGLPNH
ncbi:formylglycine-generating enzyme family protein [Ideonella sp. 4Y11]|uniref:Formylglycine-generating enzyme family protein n=1 Tax=Ideonella aquatica TaxID=2824119 RepID=A0A940YZ43_9BURK|nr:formylglycine-generating enzyme family protein [Ideonella aquatica]MBQ0961795.1 formylglycine-generating enzyme family protein [Ideonella aquatica]